MFRVLVALLAAFDALVAAAVGIAAALAPLTLLWVFALGGPDWASLWPTAAIVWQFGHGASVQITLPAEYLSVAGIDTDAAAFTLSLAPLAFGVFTALFAARSGRRAVRAGAGLTGLVAGALAFTAAATLVELTSSTSIASTDTAGAIAGPALFYIVPAAVGVIGASWLSEDEDGPIQRMRDWIETRRGGWAPVPGLVVRGAAIVVVALVGLGALGTAVMTMVRGPEVLALYQSANLDAVGATVVTLGQFAYLPTLIVWAIAYLAGPGFAFGSASTIAPSGTVVGVVPGIPALGLLPEVSTPWLLVLVLLPIGAGAFAGWALRSRLVASADPAAERVSVHLVLTAGVAVLSGAIAALVATLASGAVGPGRLAETGPQPGALAVAVALEVAVGCGILLLSPRRADARGTGMRGSRDEGTTLSAGAGAGAGAPSIGAAWGGDRGLGGWTSAIRPPEAVSPPEPDAAVDLAPEPEPGAGAETSRLDEDRTRDDTAPLD